MDASYVTITGLVVFIVLWIMEAIVLAADNFKVDKSNFHMAGVAKEILMAPTFCNVFWMTGFLYFLAIPIACITAFTVIHYFMGMYITFFTELRGDNFEFFILVSILLVIITLMGLVAAFINYLETRDNKSCAEKAVGSGLESVGQKVRKTKVYKGATTWYALHKQKYCINVTDK